MNNPSTLPAAKKPVDPLPYSFVETRRKIINLFLWGAVAAGVLIVYSFWGHPTPLAIGTVLAAFVLLLVTALVPLPYPIRAGLLLTIVFGFAINEVLQSGIFGNAHLFFLVFTLLAGVLFDRREFLAAAALSLLTLLVLGALITAGKLTLVSPGAVAGNILTWIVQTVLMLLAAAGFEAGWRWLRREYFVVQATLKNAMNTLSSERTALEARITERTKAAAAQADLQKARADRYHLAAEIMKAVASFQEPDELVQEITRQVAGKFNLYHVGLYLHEPEGGYTVLRAAEGASAEKLLNSGTRLKIDQSGVVNYVAASGLPRVARRVKDDILYETNPDLPETKSLIALPLQSNQRTIGVLDLESSLEGGLNDQDLEVMNTLADQITLAFENVRVSSETRQALAEARVVYGHYMREAWEKIATQRQTVGYRYAASRTNPLEFPLDQPEVQTALESGKAVAAEDKPAISIPLKLRDEVIGVLDIRSGNADRQWNENELALVQAVAERVSLALENARLFEETTRRADRERTVSEITTHIRSTTDPQVMLRTALDELKKALGAKDVRIHPYTPPSPGQPG
jgi:GAF domain-containing protein